MLMLRNAHRGTTHTLKNYVDQMLNGAINHYNSILTTTYDRIATLETEITYLQGELTRLPVRGPLTYDPRAPPIASQHNFIVQPLVTKEWNARAF